MCIPFRTYNIHGCMRNETDWDCISNSSNILFVDTTPKIFSRPFSFSLPLLRHLGSLWTSPMSWWQSFQSQVQDPTSSCFLMRSFHNLGLPSKVLLIIFFIAFGGMPKFLDTTTNITLLLLYPVTSSYIPFYPHKMVGIIPFCWLDRPYFILFPHHFQHLQRLCASSSLYGSWSFSSGVLSQCVSSSRRRYVNT
jgi:hypothetical protein